MAALSSNLPSPSDHTIPGRTELERVASSLVAGAVPADSTDMLVIALFPQRPERRVIASAGNSAIRAAVSVAVAADNLRAWSPVNGEDVADISLNGLPEIIRSSVQPCGMQSVRVGVVADGQERVALTMWLSPSAQPTARMQGAHVEALAMLRRAVVHDRIEREASALPAPTATSAPVSAAAPGAEPEAVELPGPEHFTAALDDASSDAMAVLVIATDEPISSPTRDAIGGRIRAAIRKRDIAAAIDDDTFAILLVDVDRKTAFDISKRLRAELGEPILTASGVSELSYSVGLAHEDGLVDATELFESAMGAMEGARDEGGARMLVAT